MGRQNPRATAPGVTFAEAIDELARQYEAGIPRVLTRRTLEGYRSTLRIVGTRWTGSVARTMTAQVDDWVAAMRMNGLASSTIRNLLSQLSAVFKLCVRRGWLAHVPCEIPRPRLVAASEVDALPESDYARILTGARGDWDAIAVLLIAGDCGLRVAEIQRLEWRDVRFAGDGGSIHVRVEGERRRTKSGKGRNVPLTPRLRAHLWPRRRAAGAVIVGTKDEQAINRKASRAWKAVLGGSATLHRLRHRYGTALARNGVHVTVIKLLMGHAKIETTMRYLHAVPEVPAEALWALGGQSKRRKLESEPKPKSLKK